MKAIVSFLLIAILGGLGDAIYLPGHLAAATTNRFSRRGPPPPYKELDISYGSVTSYHFFSSINWRTNPAVKNNRKAQAVLSNMGSEGLFTAVVMRGAKMYCVGDAKGKTDLPDFVIKETSNVENCIYTNGGFFITGKDKQLKAEHDGPIIADLDKLMYYSVGATSVTPNSVNPPKAHASQYHKLEGDDKSFLHCAPSLEKPVNEKARELQYWAKDKDGNNLVNPAWKQETFDKKEDGHAVTWCDQSRGWKITDPIKKGTNGAVASEEWVRTVFSHIPGGTSTANEKNERLVAVLMADKTKLVFAYTSKRSAGVTINGMRDLINVFLGQ
jgi:hypothetical protein